MTASSHARADAPLVEVALFSDASLRDPYGDYQRLRDLAPIVICLIVGAIILASILFGY